MSNDNRYGTNKEQDNKPGASRPSGKGDASAASPVAPPPSPGQEKEKDKPDAP